MTDITRPSESVARQLRKEYKAQHALLEAQPPLAQRFLEAQGRQLGETLAQQQRVSQLRFALPERVVIEAHGRPVPVPAEAREQLTGGRMDRLIGTDVRDSLRHHLTELDQSPSRAVAVSAGLIRYVTATHLVHNMLPAGRSVTYVPAEGEEVASIPLADALEPASAITATTDAIVEEGKYEEGRGELQVPYAPAARKFYLPRWVAFDDEGGLLVNTVAEAEAHVASMQRFLRLLHLAVGLAPYMVADEDYQRKRYGMLGQLINQGRALARHQTREIIGKIRRKAAAGDLNRGLSLSLPYLDDQMLEMRLLEFEVIPIGRTMFVPAFVVLATRREQARLSQDTHQSYSTRMHLLAQLKLIERAFEPAEF